MQIQSSIYINRDIDSVYKVLKSIENYPNFMLGVESIRLLEDYPNKKISEWRININGTIIEWVQENLFDDDKYQIKFKVINGDLNKFDGTWQLKLENGVLGLSFSAELDWSGPLAIRYKEVFIKRKAEAIIKSMLRAFRARIIQGDCVEIKDTIISENVTYVNRNGKKIVACFDHLRSNWKNSPFIILPPGYGETKRDTLSTSYYLVKNGFNCIRYDATDHLGESDGDIEHTTMTKLKNDLLSSVDYIAEEFNCESCGVVASSLGKRVALKAVSEDKRIKLLVSIVGVVNLQDTLSSVYKEDMIGSCIAGKKWPVTDVLGFKVSGRFLESAVEDKFHDLTSTINDTSKVDIPVVFLVAENDAWVKLKDVSVVYEKLGKNEKDLIVLPEVMHQLHENPKAARIALKNIVIYCKKYLSKKKLELDNVLEPNLREIAVQNRIEKERLRLLDVFAADKEKDFWSDYLASFVFINKSKDYREYLSLITELLDKIKDGVKILDAGCGVGYFGAWLFNKIIEENESNKRLNLYSQSKYCAIDFVKSAIGVAINNHQQMKKIFLEKNNMLDKADIFFPSIYQECDLNFDLPFKDNYFDKICCSLVLSYLNDPVITMQELMRVLKPGGRIVVTTLKPFADLSQIYRNFVAVASSEHDITEARRLLSNAGQIKYKERQGHYHFFNEKELKIIGLAANGKNIKIFRSLGNQANVMLAEKLKG